MERLPDLLISWRRLNQRRAENPAIHVKKRAALCYKVWIAQIERAIQIAKIHLAKVVKKRDWVAHSKSCPKTSAASPATSSGMSRYVNLGRPYATLSEGGIPEQRIKALSVSSGGRKRAGTLRLRSWRLYFSTRRL